MHRYRKSRIRIQIPQNAQQEGLIKKIEAYRESIFKMIIYYILCIVTGGLFYLLTQWFVRLQIIVRFQKCKVDSADYFLIYSFDKTLTLIPSAKQCISLHHQKKIFKVKLSLIKILEYRFYKYYFDEIENMFVPLELNLSGAQNNQVLDRYHKGILDRDQLDELVSLYGLNKIAIPDRGIIKVLIVEVLNPFYIFSIFSVCLWLEEAYYTYAIIILIFALISIGGALHQYLVNFRKLQAIAQIDSEIKIHRFTNGLTYIKNGKVEINEQLLYLQDFVQMSSQLLVPGDLIHIEADQIMPCDSILLTGQCVMNEAILTGECIPVLKNPLPYNKCLYNYAEEGKISTLFAGTVCIETKTLHRDRIPILAVVTQTGFKTLKGQLIRSIMFSSQNSFQFYKDAFKIIGVLGILAFISFLITLNFQIKPMSYSRLNTTQITIKFLDFVTIAVPPTMPVFLQVSISIALFRLKKKQIFCISPFKIITAGQLSVMCFDKTGTLTEDCLNIHGVLTIGLDVSQNQLGFKYLNNGSPKTTDLIMGQELGDDIIVYEYKQYILTENILSADLQVKYTMATCHGLNIHQGKIIGDPLDVLIFESTKSNIMEQRQSEIQGYQYILLNELLDSGESSLLQIRLEILRKFDFSSKLQRMTVIVRTPDGIRICCKGSPESLLQLCLYDSIPKNFELVLEDFAQKGFRIIALAIRILNSTLQCIQTIERDVVECKLTFLGFIILENKLKPITTSVIRNLQEANIRTIMVTGDNLLTSISVARQCNIIEMNQNVYQGDLELDMKTQRRRIIWTNLGKGANQSKDQKLISPTSLKKNHFQNKEIKDQAEINIFASQKKSIFKQYSKLKSVRDQQESPEISTQKKKITTKTESWLSQIDNYTLALTGAAFSHLIESEKQNSDPILQTIIERTQVFARMNPEDKRTLVKQLQNRLNKKSLIGFCGDGANDCTALKVADVGISIGQAESSLAAPFNSQIQNISCVMILICEGRAALTTAFICFKYMILYSMIQFTTACILYFSYTDLTLNGYLHTDLFTVLPLSMTMGFTHAKMALTKEIPIKSLISFPVLCSLLGQGIIQVVFQLIVYALLLQKSWLVEAQNLYPLDEVGLDEDIHITYESTSMFLFANLQYIFTIIAFSINTPFREPFYTNIYFSVYCFLISIFDYSLMLFYYSDSDPFYGYFGLLFRSSTTFMPEEWIIFLGLMSLLNGIVSIFYERVVVTQLTGIFLKCKKRNQ